MKIKERLKKFSISYYVILFFLPAVTFVNFNHHNYEKEEGVIIWDIKSYYAYLPAAFIYNDLSLDFINEHPEKKLNKWIWPLETPTGKKALITSCGLSVMYSPFFFIAHGVAKLHPKHEADGYSTPYHIALTFSALIYFILALLILRKILLRYFPDKVTALTLFIIGAGTNLFYYISYEAPMSHAYNFFLIILFLFLLIKWNNKINVKYTLLLGLTAGLIALVRPTNIIILLLIPLYGVTDLKTLNEHIKKLLRHWYLIIIMAFAFILVWIPQFAYWLYVSGKVFYFSYGEKGGNFFFINPQITDFLFSYKKGWYIYTPVMLFATLGIIRLIKIKHEFSLGILIFLILNIYILSSWWSWWFGGAFGLRSMIDSYGLMALPLAALIAKKWKYKYIGHAIISALIILTAFNQFQVQQYRNGAIHYWWMNKEAYWETFLKSRPTCKYWKVIQIPNYEKARKGVYEFTHSIDKKADIEDSSLKEEIIQELKENNLISDSLKNISLSDSVQLDTLFNNYAHTIITDHKAEKQFKKLKVQYLIEYINACKSWREEIETKADKDNMSYNEAVLIEANRVYENYSEKYKDTF